MVVGEVPQSGACMGASLGSQSNLGAESENLSLWHQEIVSFVDGSRLPCRGDDHSARLSFPPITDIVAGEVVVPTVHLPYAGTVEVYRDRQVVARVPYPVNTSVVG